MSQAGDNLINTAALAVREMMRADLEIRYRALAGPDAFRSRRMPTILCLRRMRASLTAFISVVDTRTVLLFFKQRDAWTTGEFRIDLTIEPSNVAIADAEPAVEFAPPTLLLAPAGDRGVLLQLADGRTMLVNFKGDADDADVESVTLDGERRDADEYWELHWHVAFLLSLARWGRNRGQASAARPLDLSTVSQGSLKRLLQTASQAYVRLRAQVAAGGADVPEMRQLDRELRERHRDFGAGYRLGGLRAGIYAWFDAAGELADQPGVKRRLKVAVTLEADDVVDTAGLARPRLRVTAHPPDVLSQGPVHARFIEGLRAAQADAGKQIHDSAPWFKGTRAREAWARLIDRLPASTGAATAVENDRDDDSGEAAAAAAGATPPGVGVIFVRVAEGATNDNHEHDTDVILLHDPADRPASWILFQADVRVPEAATEVVGMSEFKFLACQDAEGTFDASGNRLDALIEYERMALRSLRQWQAMSQ